MGVIRESLMPPDTHNPSLAFDPPRVVSGLVRQEGLLASAGLAFLVCAAAALPMFEAVTAYTVTSFGVLAALSIFLAWRHARRAPTQVAAAKSHHGRGAKAESLGRLLQSVLPVWQQHVGASRAQVEAAVTDLVVNFDQITAEFESAGFSGAVSARQESHRETGALLSMCEHDLKLVIQALSEVTLRKGEMASSMNELSLGTKDLQAMANGVAQIAAQTNLLAINAAIEAAHAGDAGRGFATIAKEIRSLSQLSAQTASQITDRIGRVTTVMHETSEAVAKAAEHEKGIFDRSSHAVNGVLTHMRQLSEDALAMKSRGNAIRHNIEHLMVSMQFQDRVNQILSVVEDDMARLKHQADADGPVPDSHQWLRELEGHYTMNEQHRPGAFSPEEQAAPPAGNAVYF
jgi:methyl-accepting chemotaxis protein